MVECRGDAMDSDGDLSQLPHTFSFSSVSNLQTGGVSFFWAWVLQGINTCKLSIRVYEKLVRSCHGLVSRLLQFSVSCGDNHDDLKVGHQLLLLNHYSAQFFSAAYSQVRKKAEIFNFCQMLFLMCFRYRKGA